MSPFLHVFFVSDYMIQLQQDESFFVGIQLSNTSCSIWWSCQTTLSSVYLGGAKTPGLQYFWYLPSFFGASVIVSTDVLMCFLGCFVEDCEPFPGVGYPIFSCFWLRKAANREPTNWCVGVSPWGLVSTWKMRVTTMMATSAASGSWSSPMRVPWVELNSLPTWKPRKNRKNKSWFFRVSSIQGWKTTQLCLLIMINY